MSDKKYNCGYIIAHVQDDDFRNYEWLKEASLQCKKLILGIPDNEAARSIMGCTTSYDAKSYDAERIKEYWLNMKWIDDVIILDANHLYKYNLPIGYAIDVCFFGSDYGTRYCHDVEALSSQGVQCVTLCQEGIKRIKGIDTLDFILAHSSNIHKIVLFGTGKYFDYYMMNYGTKYPPAYAVDNNHDKWNTIKDGVKILSPEIIKTEKAEDILVIVCSKNCQDMLDQICSYGDYDYRTLVRNEEMSILEEYPLFQLETDATQRILKKIHEINYDMLEEFDSVCRKHGIEYFLNYGSILGAVRHKGFIPWDNDVDTVIKRDEFEKLEQYKDEFSHLYFWLDPACLGKKKYFDCVPRLGYRFAHVKEDEEFCRYYNNLYNGIHLDMFFIDKTRDNLWGKLQRFELAVLYGLMNAYRHPKFFEDYDEKMRRKNRILCRIGKHISLLWLKKKADKVARRFDNDSKAEYYFISNDALHKLTLLFPKEIFDHAVDMPFGRVNAKVSCDADKMCKILFGDYMQLPSKEQRVPHFGRRLLKASLFEFDENMEPQEKDKCIIPN